MELNFILCESELEVMAYPCHRTAQKLILPKNPKDKEQSRQTLSKMKYYFCKTARNCSLFGCFVELQRAADTD